MKGFRDIQRWKKDRLTNGPTGRDEQSQETFKDWKTKDGPMQIGN